MNHIPQGGQLDLSDRVAIETGICRKESFKKIGMLLHRHPSTIANEIKENRTLIRGNYPNGKDCKFVRVKNKKHLCGDMECDKNCCRCWKFKCTEVCPSYVSVACHKFEKPPYVCNACPDKKLCNKEKYIYSAKHADAAAAKRRSESRQGIRISAEEKQALDCLITQLVKKGQPLTHIFAEHKQDIPVSLRTLYNYIDSGELTVKNIDLRRKTGYKPRKKGKTKAFGFANMDFRKQRTYADFEQAIKTTYSNSSIVEMDTVRGIREQGKRLLTMIFRDNNIMLLFLMPDGKAESVKRIFDFLYIGLGEEVFQRLFQVILTDNGSEFKRVIDLEFSEDLFQRTHIFFCDPMASWQKGCLEKNHEFIRYVIPKGKSLNQYSQDDITLLMNHINSIKRPSLGNKCPYDFVRKHDTDMKELMCLLKMHLIPPDEVHLKPDLFSKK